jgi:hypothetical protein
MSAVLNDARDIQTLRYYLRLWVRHERGWRADLGHRHAVNWVGHVMGGVAYADEGDEAEEMYGPADRKILTGIITAVEDLPARERAALRLIYLREVGPAVYRNGRLDMKEAGQLCEIAERKILLRVRCDF